MLEIIGQNAYKKEWVKRRITEQQRFISEQTDAKVK